MNETHENVKAYYSEVLSSSNDIKTTACSMTQTLHPTIKSIIKNIPYAKILWMWPSNSFWV